MTTKKNTRTANVIRNAWVGLVAQFVVLIVSFINRTVFIDLLGNDYLSVNGLFSNIITTLSFVELGFGTALLYLLYKPVAVQDENKIKSIMAFYRKTYSIIGIIIFALGLMVIPFMDIIIKDPPNLDENLIFIYILFLISTCISYFFAHKSAIINAHQQNYVVTICNQSSKVIQSIAQIIFLIITKNYIIYLIIQIIMSFINNIYISIKANKMYPYIKDLSCDKLDKEDKKIVGNKVKSLIFYRLNPAITNGTDNLIMSACINIASVGIYSNYYLITNYLNIFIKQVTSSFETSVGNLNALDDVKQKEYVLYKILYVCFLIYGIVCVLLMGCMNDFIRIWLGEEYLFNNFIVFTILLYIFIGGLQFPIYTYRSTSGLFEKAKFIPLYDVIINIFLSIFLAKKIGIAGIFLATSISKIFTFFWSDPRIIYKYLFKNNNIGKYFKKYLYYVFITILIGFGIYHVSNLIIVTNYLAWFIKSCGLGIITILLFMLFTYKMVEYKEFKNVVQEYIKKINIKNFLRRSNG